MTREDRNQVRLCFAYMKKRIENIHDGNLDDAFHLTYFEKALEELLETDYTWNDMEYYSDNG